MKILHYFFLNQTDSLGGAVASITALDFNYHVGLPCQSYSFGSPRTGEKNYVMAYQKYVPSYWRMTHNEDPVPHVPLASMGFLHIDHEIFEHGTGEGSFYTCTPTANEDPKCSAQYKSTWLLHIESDISQHLTYMGL